MEINYMSVGASLRSIDKVMQDVEREEFEGCGGLSSGIYGEFTKEVAEQYGNELKAFLIACIKDGIDAETIKIF